MRPWTTAGMGISPGSRCVRQYVFVCVRVCLCACACACHLCLRALIAWQSLRRRCCTTVTLRAFGKGTNPKVPIAAVPELGAAPPRALVRLRSCLRLAVLWDPILSNCGWRSPPFQVAHLRKHMPIACAPC